MSSRYHRLCYAVGMVVTFALAPASGLSEEASSGGTDTHTTPVKVLRVAADPNNLPFTNSNLEGFENKIAGLLAEEMGAKLEWVWHAQRRGFIRNTLKANKADITLAVPTGFEMARATPAYYYSSYVFVTRTADDLHPESLDDPVLQSAIIGVQLIGDDGSNTPPVHALARRGIISNIRGYTVYGDYKTPNPPARIIKAVADGEIDIAIAWGPLAGYFAANSAVPLTVLPVKPLLDEPSLPMAYGIAVGVRRGDDALYQAVTQALENRSSDIQSLLEQYHIPIIAKEDVPIGRYEDDD